MVETTQIFDPPTPHTMAKSGPAKNLTSKKGSTRERLRSESRATRENSERENPNLSGQSASNPDSTRAEEVLGQLQQLPMYPGGPSSGASEGESSLSLRPGWFSH